MFHFARFACASLIMHALTSPASAAIGSSFGFSSRAASLGGAMVASDRDGASAYQNPAALSLGARTKPNEKLAFHWAMLYMTPDFTDISNVIVENNFTSDQIRYSNVDTEYPDTFGQSFGFSYEFKQTRLRWGFGMLAFLPLDELAIVDSGETFIPEYMLQRSRNQKPEFDVGVSMKPAANLSLGAGVHLGAALTSNTTIFLQTDATKTSTMRVSASLKTKATPYFGANLALTPSLATGLVIRLPFAQTEKLKVNASSRVLGNIAALDFNFPALATMYYDPLSVELGTKWDYSDTNRFLFQIDYQTWSKFESPALEIQSTDTTTCSGAPCGIEFSTSKNPSFEYRDIFIPRVGHEWDLGRSTLRVGYSYRPSILKNTPSGAGNYLDPSEHRMVAGWGYQFTKFLDFDTPCRLDFHLAYHQLESQRITKTSGDETGAGSGEQKIGAPGYEAGGRLLGGGLSLNLSL